MMTTNESDRVRRLTSEDESLIAFKQKLEENSLDALETSARQIITLVTSLFGLFLGILAFKDQPIYLSYPDVKLFAVFGIGLLVSALFFALAVVMPRQHQPKDLKAVRTMLFEIFSFKKNNLTISIWCFGIGLLSLLLMVIDLILFRL